MQERGRGRPVAQPQHFPFGGRLPRIAVVVIGLGAEPRGIQRARHGVHGHAIDHQVQRQVQAVARGGVHQLAQRGFHGESGLQGGIALIGVQRRERAPALGQAP